MDAAANQDEVRLRKGSSISERLVWAGSGAAVLLLVESDAPYLAPGPYRGKRNEPAYVVEVAKVLAETRGVSLDEMSHQTTENFFRLFSKVKA